MPKSADGEFEVLLGNKQLLSIFFIVVILLAVFFTMGFVLGRNSASGEAAMAASKKAAPEPAPSAPAAGPATRPQAQLPAVETQPPAREPVLPATPAEPVSGQAYLQVVAAKRPDAELIVGVLKRKGFPALIAPGPNESVFRALVGPLEDADAIAKTRADLETAGFKPILRKY